MVAFTCPTKADGAAKTAVVPRRRTSRSSRAASNRELPRRSSLSRCRKGIPCQLQQALAQAGAGRPTRAGATGGLRREKKRYCTAMLNSAETLLAELSKLEAVPLCNALQALHELLQLVHDDYMVSFQRPCKAAIDECSSLSEIYPKLLILFAGLTRDIGLPEHALRCLRKATGLSRSEFLHAVSAYLSFASGTVGGAPCPLGGSRPKNLLTELTDRMNLASTMRYNPVAEATRNSGCASTSWSFSSICSVLKRGLTTLLCSIEFDCLNFEQRFELPTFELRLLGR